MSIRSFFRSKSMIVLSILFVIHVVAAILFPNMIWPDEIFQILEQSHRHVFGYGIIPHEFQNGLRSHFLPLLLSPLLILGDFSFFGQPGYQILVTLFLSLLFVAPIWAYLKVNQPWDTLNIIIFAAIVGLWSELLLFGTKAFSEVIGAHFILFCVPFLFHFQGQHKSKSLFLFGLLLGIGGLIRIHYLPVVAVILFWFFYKNTRAANQMIITGVLVAVAIFGVIDWFTWDYPFQSLWNNIHFNLIEGKSADWGTAGWDFYFTEILGRWGMFPTFFILASALLGGMRYPVYLLMIVAVLLPHMAIAHKEFRFIYLAIYLILILSSFGCVMVLEKLKSRNRLYAGYGFIFFWVVGMLWLNSNNSDWNRHAGTFKAFRYLSNDQMMCGLGLENIPWYWTGGYYSLHKNVPMIDVKGSSKFMRKDVNRLLLSGYYRLPKTLGSFDIVKCWGGTCLYSNNIVCENPKVIKYKR